MSFFENWNDDQKFSFWAFVFILVGLAILFFSKIGMPKGRKASKKSIAESYGVEIKILKKWIHHFGTAFEKKQLAGRERNVLIIFDYSLGKPKDRPKHNDKPIISKADIWKASGFSESTVYHKIRALENPEEVIKMSYKTYQSLNYFPPKHTKLILDFLKNGEAQQPDFSPAYNPFEKKSDPKLP